jgi:hypothetical protein
VQGHILFWDRNHLHLFRVGVLQDSCPPRMFIAWLNRKKNSCHIKFPPFYFPGLEWPNTHRRSSHKSRFRIHGGRTFLPGKLKNSSQKMDKTILIKLKTFTIKEVYNMDLYGEPWAVSQNESRIIYWSLLYWTPQMFRIYMWTTQGFFLVYLCFVNTFNKV